MLVSLVSDKWSDEGPKFIDEPSDIFDKRRNERKLLAVNLFTNFKTHKKSN